MVTIVCSALIERDRKYLLIKAKIGVPKGLWNNPGGRKDEGESIEQATVREVKEETGLENVQILGRTKEWIAYDWPDEARKKKGFIGQRQIYFVGFVEDEEILKLTPSKEFAGFKWASWEEVMSNVVDFKKEAYNLAWSELKELIIS